MGLLRVLLAIAVIVGHSKDTLFGIEFMKGRTAVQVFYMISGFYMALILTEKYSVKKDSYRLFFTNRLLRLYPIYLAVLLITVVVCMLIGTVTDNFSRLQPYFTYRDLYSNFALVYFILVNILVIGQDTLLFMKLDSESGNFLFSSSYQKTDPPLYLFNLVPQAWTIGLELLFYLIAPFLARKSTFLIIILIVISAGARVITYNVGFDHDPWTYRFFPFEIAFFLLGIISYRIYLYLQLKKISKNFLIIIFGNSLIFSVGLTYFPISYQWKELLYFVVMFISIPFIFILTKKNKKDQRIGEYSYPLYICHILVITAVSFLINKAGLSREFMAELSLIGSFIFSFLLLKLISEPIEKIRSARYQKSTVKT